MVVTQTGFDDASGPAPLLSVLPWRDAAPDPGQWDMLAASASEPNPFFERWFLLPSLEAFDPQGRVRLAQLRIDDRLVALVPLTLSFTYYGKPLPHLAVWLHDNAFCGVPLIARGFDTAHFHESHAFRRNVKPPE